MNFSNTFARVILTNTRLKQALHLKGTLLCL